MTRTSRTWLLGGLLLAASCTDAGTPMAPEGPSPVPDPVLQALDCSVVLGQSAMTCQDAQPRTGGALGSGSVIVGGQGVFIRLASSNLVFTEGRLRLDVTVQNLIDQPLGTADGATRHARGVRVWFHDGPNALPAGSAQVVNADGEGIFASAPQPYFQYDTVLAKNQVSAPRRWEMEFTPGAERVTFTVYVVAEVEHQEDRVEMPGAYKFVLPGDTVRFHATVRDFTGRERNRQLQWSSSDTTVLTIDSTGLARGKRRGGVYVEARLGESRASAPAAVVSLDEATSIESSPAVDTIDMGERIQIVATAYNLRGEPLTGPISYSERNIWVVTTNFFTGTVRGTYPGTTPVYVGRDWATDTLMITTRSGPEVTWAAVSTGQHHTCGVTTTGKGYCWGANGVGQLGIGQTSNYGELVPVAVAGDHRWTYIDAGLHFACGLDTDGAAWCWGPNFHGNLGNGTVGYGDAVPTPGRVAGGLRFAAISAGYEHACALTEEGEAYCWGNNTYGQLGNDTITVPFGEGAPVPVVGGLRFREISVTRDFSCAITLDDDMYCWGDDEVGQLGDDAGAPSRQVPHPVLVAGGHKWKTVATADSHACALTVKGRAYCWGADFYGELGIGVSEVNSNVPAPVESAETFVDIGVGSTHSCAVTENGDAYCWGDNYFAKLGDGTKESPAAHPTPLRVIGGVSFAGFIEGGEEHTCALGSNGRAYCWGTDFNGESGVQPDTEFCKVPGGVAPCHTQPRVVENPAPGGVRTGPSVGFSRSGVSAEPSRAPVETGRPRLLPRRRSR